MPAKPIAVGSGPTSVSLHHPTPDLQSLQGAYRSNISRLEQSAERLSQASSDLGEEIRKMIEAEKEKDQSRNSSLQSSHVEPQPVRERIRTDSYANSIVDVNNAARWGGYSPGGFVTSPVGSVHSGSWIVNRQASGSKSSRFAQMVEPMQEGRPLDSPLAPSTESLHSQEQQMSRRASQSSFARRYDQIEEPLHALPSTSPVPEDESEHLALPVLDTRASVDTLQDYENVFKDFDGVHFSPDTEEYVELDERGNEVRRVSARTSSGSLLDAATLLRSPPVPRPISYAAPPPGEGMIYYPAPVPRVLNLPKRLSQIPSSNVHSQRRSQMLSEMSPQHRNSAPWLSNPNVSDPTRSPPSSSATSGDRRSVLNPRASFAHLANLPPHLRASLFFEHEPISQDVNIQSESAVATLDSILEASATAPVSVFTDHPYAGDVRKSVYAPEIRHGPKRSSTNFAALTQAAKKPTKRRSSSMGRLFRRNSNDPEEELNRPASRGSTLILGGEDGRKVSRRRSQLSLGDELETKSNLEPMMSSGLVAHASNYDHEEERAAAAARPSTALAHDILTNSNQQIEDDFRDEDEQEDIDETEPIFAAPTTLLAELQVRKAQQKSRGRTAPMAFPNGMHSTLLEMDAVEEINRKNRKKQRVALAWEDPVMHAQEAEKAGNDDDVPLGMLFPPKDGQKTRKFGDARDWQRPMGLMEKRELEDSEPLSSRRHRLHGLPPSRTNVAIQSTVQLVEPTDEDAGEDVTETLGQRVRRLKTKDALDSTISEFAPKEGERPVSTFTDDIMSQFGGLDVKEKAGNGVKAAAVVPPEEETLGQRRARLQREREASGEADSGARPQLHSAQSLANLLAVNPVGTRTLAKEAQPSYGSLLHISAQAQSKHKQDLMIKNLQSTNMSLNNPLVDAQYINRTRVAPATGLLGNQTSAPAVGGFAKGAYNNGNGGVMYTSPLMPSAATTTQPMFGVTGTNTYFTSPTAAAYGMGGYPVPQQQQMMNNPMASPSYAALNAARMSSVFPTAHPQAYPHGMMGGYGMQQMGTYAAPLEMSVAAAAAAAAAATVPAAPMDTQQRAAIDRWRMSIGG